MISFEAQFQGQPACWGLLCGWEEKGVGDGSLGVSDLWSDTR